MKYVLWAVALAAVAFAAMFWLLRNPLLSSPEPLASVTPSIGELKKDVNFLAGMTPNRSVANLASLNRAGDYIRAELEKTGCRLEEQRFGLREVTLRNISCFTGPTDAPRLIIGAHYDVYSSRNPGADDNASGVAGLIELAYLLGKKPVQRSIELVAYSLEEALGQITATATELDGSGSPLSTSEVSNAVAASGNTIVVGAEGAGSGDSRGMDFMQRRIHPLGRPSPTL